MFKLNNSTSVCCEANEDNTQEIHFTCLGNMVWNEIVVLLFYQGVECISRVEPNLQCSLISTMNINGILRIEKGLIGLDYYYHHKNHVINLPLPLIHDNTIFRMSCLTYLDLRYPSWHSVVFASRRIKMIRVCIFQIVCVRNTKRTFMIVWD